MSIANLTPTQLREAADLLEKIAQLQNQLEHLHGSEAAPVAGPPTKPAKRKMTAAHIAKIRAAQKLRWAKVRAAKPVAASKPAAIPVKKGPKTMSAEARAKIAAAQKARWAKVHAAKGKPTTKPEVAAKAAPVSKPAKKTISAEGIARIRAAQKARWAKIKAAKK
jgi:hypothetical protein